MRLMHVSWLTRDPVIVRVRVARFVEGAYLTADKWRDVKFDAA